jgi:hypothetical protein
MEWINDQTHSIYSSVLPCKATQLCDRSLAGSRLKGSAAPQSHSFHNLEIAEMLRGRAFTSAARHSGAARRAVANQALVAERAVLGKDAAAVTFAPIINVSGRD